MYEMEGTSPGLTVPRRQSPGCPTPQAAAGAKHPCEAPVSRLLPRPGGSPRMMPVSSSNVFLLPPRKLRKVLRLLISSFFAIHMVSTEPGKLFAFGGGCPRSYAQFIHRNLGITRERDTVLLHRLARCHRQRRMDVVQVDRPETSLVFALHSYLC